MSNRSATTTLRKNFALLPPQIRPMPAAGLNVVRFLQQFKGPAAARQELMARINAGGQVFQYQLALADFDLAQGKVADSIQLLESLVSNAGSPEDMLAAQVKLAQIQFQQKKFDRS